MIIYPAIDLRNGKVVRLKEGKLDAETIYSENPLDTAKQWIDQGAGWIHVVNLDGAFDTQNDNARILEQITRLNVKVQFGGGLRSLNEVTQAVNQGASRVVIGTLAVQDPDAITQAVAQFGADKLCIALDAKDGKVATHGWQQTAELTPVDFGRRLAAQGIIHALYTDVKRDGSMIGVNIMDTIHLARDTGLQVIASGGVSNISEINQLARSQVVAGAVIGVALYEGKLTLIEALMAARSGGSAG